MHKKLFIPGPVEVYPEVLNAMATPMIGHRTKEYADLHGAVKTKLQQLLYTKNKIFLVTASGTGIMEACVRNCVNKRAAHFVCGEFGERWFGISVANGKEADKFDVPLGKAIKPEMVDNGLKTGDYDTVFITHNETSVGVMNPLSEIAEVVKKYPDVLLIVDAVSSMGGVKIEVDKWGIDVCLSSTQKGFALPPGFAVCSVSNRALEKAKQVKNRGYYFDFLEFDNFDAKNQTPTTPSVSHLFALNYQLDQIFKEGLEKRFNRHKELAQICRDWVRNNNFRLFTEPGYESITMTTADNTRNINIAKLNEELGKVGYMISAGYGKLKDTTFRIAHMGDTTTQELRELLSTMESIIRVC
ncbi:MAG: alanine--glyoxylate aminotransferase family protein [Planctomycetota bacterium]|nr:alanine--glyoxylate aminotransferase family protein [Planctomycetota bacterium]MDI6787650.1 alanine--glyoxylate aminotransferase family protein [Planctomycetota bacterium]